VERAIFALLRWRSAGGDEAGGWSDHYCWGAEEGRGLERLSSVKVVRFLGDESKDLAKRKETKFSFL
jgi:hypothetical protein